MTWSLALTFGYLGLILAAECVFVVFAFRWRAGK